MITCPWSPPEHPVTPDPEAAHLPLHAIGQCTTCLMLYRVTNTHPYQLEWEASLSRFVQHALAASQPADAEANEAAALEENRSEPLWIDPDSLVRRARPAEAP